MLTVGDDADMIEAWHEFSYFPSAPVLDQGAQTLTAPMELEGFFMFETQFRVHHA